MSNVLEMPVVVQPACANQSLWTTTNSEYGDFYISVHNEVTRQSELVVHKECTKKANALEKELRDVKAKLECLKQRSKSEPCLKTGFILPPRTNLNPNLFSPKIGKCDCPSGSGPPNSNPYISVCKNEFNGAKKHDPQFLEQHIKTEHPRLVKRVYPPKPYTAPCIIGSGDHFLGDDKNASDCESRGGSKVGNERPRHCKMIGLYKRTNSQCPSRCASQDKSNNNNMHIRVVGNNGNNYNSSRSNDIPNLTSQPTSDQRYNFYRYYDKYSSGFHFGDIFYNDNESICAQAMHRGYLEEIFPHIKSCISSTPNISFLPCDKHRLHSEECPKFLSKDIEITDFDFCCYGKLSKDEIINFSTSKVSKYIELSKLPILCFESSKLPIPCFESKLPPPCFESNKLSITRLNENKEIPNKLLNTQGTQTLASTLNESIKPIQNVIDSSVLMDEGIVEVKDKKTWKPRLLCELDMFLEPKYDLFNCSISDSFKSNSNTNSHKSKNEVEENVECIDMICEHDSPKSLWEPRLCYEVEISPRRDGRGYGSFNISLENEKNVNKSILKCIEIKNKQFQAHLSTDRGPRELSFELNFESKDQEDIDIGGKDFVEDETKHHQIVNTKGIHNKESHFEPNSKTKFDLEGKIENKNLNNDTNSFDIKINNIDDKINDIIKANDKNHGLSIDDKIILDKKNYLKARKNEEGYSSPRISETKNDKDSNIDSFSSLNVLSLSPQHSTAETNSIEYQLHNALEKNITPLSTIKVDSLKSHLHNQLEPEKLSTQDFIFDPLDPLYLNLYVNYDGHCVGQLKMEANTN